MFKIYESSDLELFALDEEDLETFSIPFYQSRIQAGFPSPADDYQELSLDVLKFLVDSPHSTFCVKVTGNSMEGAAIKHGSILVVDRSKTVQNESIIIAMLNGDFTVKRYRKTKGQVWLIPEHPAYDPVLVTEHMDFQIWGVVTYIITQP